MELEWTVKDAEYSDTKISLSSLKFCKNREISFPCKITRINLVRLFFFVFVCFVPG